LDTNLLVLLVVGGTDIGYIDKHKRLRGYTPTDYQMLVRLIDVSDEVIATPNVLTEVSNLIRQIGEPACSLVTISLGAVIARIRESYVPSKAASQRGEFMRLGLTDCALIEALRKSYTLLTDDIDLFHAVLRLGYNAQNFNHIREASGA